MFGRNVAKELDLTTFLPAHIGQPLPAVRYAITACHS